MRKRVRYRSVPVPPHRSGRSRNRLEMKTRKLRALRQASRSYWLGTDSPRPGEQPAYLCFRRGSRRQVSLAHLYCAFGTPFIGRCYGQIFGPRRQLPKFSNGVCRYSEIFVCLNSHLIWQSAKSDLQCGSAFGLISHKGLRTADIILALFSAADDGQEMLTQSIAARWCGDEKLGWTDYWSNVRFTSNCYRICAPHRNDAWCHNRP